VVEQRAGDAAPRQRSRSPIRALAAVLILAGLTLVAPPAQAEQRVSDTFARADSNVLGTADTGQTWAPMSLSSGQAWGVRSQKAAFLPSGNNSIRYAAIDSGSTSPDTMRIEADVTFSPVSANVGLAINLTARDHVFCKTERTPNAKQPYGFMTIGGKFDNGGETSVLGGAKSSFSSGEQLRTGTTYHVVLARSGTLVTCTITGTNADGSQVNESVTYTLLPSQADGLTSRNAGLRIRYVVNSGSSNEDDGRSRWDNVSVTDGTNTTPDGESPSAPTNPVATASAGRVDLSWSPSTDDVGVASYEISRSHDAGEPAAIGSTPSASCSPSSCSFADTTVAPSTTYSYAIVALDAAGNRSDPSAPVTITTAAAPTTETLERSVAASSDDAEETSSGEVSLTSSDLELVFESSSTGNQTVGMRFTNITLPPGATVTDSYVQFEVDEVSTGSPVSLTVQGEKALDPSTFTTATRNISSRPRTSTSVPWSPASWPTTHVAGPDQRTPNISGVIQEIVGQAGWASGNAVSIIVTGGGKRTAEAFDGSRAPVLHIEYSTA
jgi:hypothetical protein